MCPFLASVWILSLGWEVTLMRIPSSVPMPNEVPIEQEIVAYVGLDWADQQHVICWQAADSAAVQSAVVQQRPEELQAWVPDDALSRELALRVEHRRQLVNLQTKLIQQLRSHLKVYFPQALDWVGELDSLQACDFLQRWPTLAAVQKARPSQLEKFYHQHHCRRPQLIQQRLEQIRQAQPLTQDSAIVPAYSQMVLALVAQLRVLIPTLQQWQQQISQLFAQHPDAALFASFPTAVPVFAPRLQAAFGSRRDRFD